MSSNERSSGAVSPDRRGFLKMAVSGGVATIAAATTSTALVANAATPLAAPSARKRKWGMVIDLQRCILCRSCTIACKQENKTPPGMLYNPVLEEEVGTYPNVTRKWFPRPCNHCDKPACLENCPNDAIKKRTDGIVYIDPALCKGAQACVAACPYEVPLFDEGKEYHEGKGVWSEVASPELGLMAKPGRRIWTEKARKCTFCMHKQDADGNYVALPACARTCMGKAIHFGDLLDPKGELQTLLQTRKHMRRLEEAGTAPNVYYLI